MKRLLWLGTICFIVGLLVVCGIVGYVVASDYSFYGEATDTEYTFAMAQVDSLTLDIVSGSVFIKRTKQDSIHVVLENVPEGYYVPQVNDGKLTIAPQKKRTWISIDWFTNLFYDEHIIVTVYVPAWRSLNSLKLDGVNYNLDITGLQINDKISLDGVNVEGIWRDVSFGKLDIDGVNITLTIEGLPGSSDDYDIDIDGINRTVVMNGIERNRWHNSNAAHKIECDGMNVELYLTTVQ